MRRSPDSFAATTAVQVHELRGNRRAVFQLAAARVGVLEGLGIHVHHDLLTV